jgi:hypothetical protein
MDIPIHCQQSNLYNQIKTSISTDSLFIKTSNYDEEIFSDIFQSIHIPDTRDTQSTKSQSFSRSHYSSLNN